MSNGSSRIINFGAGPSALPLSVLEQTAQGLLDFAGTGIGIAEISHRSKEFTAFLAGVEREIRTQLAVPDTHSILFTQGGGTGQFSAVVLNMLARHHLLHPDLPAAERHMDYILTGSWSKKAADEARRLGGGHVHIAADARAHSADGTRFDSIPAHAHFAFSPAPAMVYYCENETVDGVQFDTAAGAPGGLPWAALDALAGPGALLPLVGDHSSSFMSRPIPRLADHAIIYAGAQKNLGPAGLTVVIVRRDCIVDVDAAARLGAAPVPITLAYRTLHDAASVYNTPSVLPIYVAGLVLARMGAQGGVAHYAALNRRKQAKLYAALERGERAGVFRIKVRPGARSWMNVTFDVLGEGASARFVAGAGEKGMRAINGHR
jgi:phosphoserine aminotransferase